MTFISADFRFFERGKYHPEHFCSVFSAERSNLKHKESQKFGVSSNPRDDHDQTCPEKSTMSTAEKIEFSLTTSQDLPEDGGTAMFVTGMLREISASYDVAFSGYELLRLLALREFDGFAAKVNRDIDGSRRLAELLDRMAKTYPQQAPCGSDYARTIRAAIASAHAQNLLNKLVIATSADRARALAEGLIESMCVAEDDVEPAPTPAEDATNEPMVAPTVATLATAYGDRIMLDTAEVAEILGLEEQTLRLWSSRQSGPIQPKKVGGRLRWLTADVQRLLN